MSFLDKILNAMKLNDDYDDDDDFLDDDVDDYEDRPKKIHYCSSCGETGHNTKTCPLTVHN